MKPFRTLIPLVTCLFVLPVACANSSGSFDVDGGGGGGQDGGGSCTAAGSVQCSGSCVDTQTDNSNCGECGKACTGGTTCSAGLCAMGCPLGETTCEGKCTDPQTDNANCGTCGKPCASGLACCSGGMCGSSCTGGLSLCDGMCTDTTKDPKNCGACDAPCMAPMNATASCAASKCSYACDSGWVDLGDGGMVVEGGTTCNCHSTATDTDPDKPDTSFQDTNCDGIDGTIADAIFVATTGVDTNPGTIMMPVLTLKHALSLAAASRPIKDVYVSMGTYTEAVTLVPGVGIYGGYDSTKGWSRALTNTTVIQSPSNIGVQGSSLTSPVSLQLLTITSSAALNAGDSSYGILIATSTAGVTVTVDACSVTAGSGHAGTAGSNGATGANGGMGAGGDQGGDMAAGGTSSCGGTGGSGGASVSGSTDGKTGTKGSGTAGGSAGTGGTSPGSCAGSGAGATPNNDTAGGSGTNGLDDWPRPPSARSPVACTFQEAAARAPPARTVAAVEEEAAARATPTSAWKSAATRRAAGAAAVEEGDARGPSARAARGAAAASPSSPSTPP